MASAESPETRAKWLLHSDLRTELIRQYARDTTSPAILTARLDKGPLSQVAYHTNVLSEHGLIALVETRPRQSTCDRFYRFQYDSDLAQVDDVKRLIGTSLSEGAA